MVVIIKREGHAESYDERKLYASIYSAALNCHHNEKDSEKITENTLNNLRPYLNENEALNSNDLMDKVIENLNDKEIVLMYKHHLDIN